MGLLVGEWWVNDDSHDDDNALVGPVKSKLILSLCLSLTHFTITVQCCAVKKPSQCSPVKRTAVQCSGPSDLISGVPLLHRLGTFQDECDSDDDVDNCL